MVFEESNWIWRNSAASADEYADFLCNFTCRAGKDCRLRIACDSNYTAYLNGELAAFGQYADYPSYKVYDEIDIGGLVRDGENRLVIVVWYYGRDSQTYIKGEAGLIFEVICSGRVVAASSDKTLSRLSRDYISGGCRNISVQLGFTYSYDMTGYDGFITGGREGFEESRVVGDISRDFHLRPIKKLDLMPRMPSVPVKYGSFSYKDSAAPPEIRMRDAELTEAEPPLTSFPLTITKEPGRDGIYIITDLLSITAGFLDFDIEIDGIYSIDIGYGEHITDGRCRTAVRNFSAEYRSKGGRNEYLNTFRRFGCRYLQLFVPADRIVINYLGIRPTMYRVSVNEYKGKDRLRSEIYDMCVNTLRQCMHEHYEDCPWREQALYTMDSRNQMLAGYYAFGEYIFPRASLYLISKGVRSDGLLSLCYPAGLDYPIPFFSLMYFIQVKEYTDYSGDMTLAKELYPMLLRLIELFLSRIDKTGLILSFLGCWNFYEWSPGMSGKMKEDNPGYEAPLNAFFSLGLSAMSSISALLGYAEDSKRYAGAAAAVAQAVRERFFNSETLLFESYDDRRRGEYSVLTNSVCLLCSAAEGLDKSRILRLLVSNGEDNFGYASIPNTLSMNCFRFDALLAQDREKYAGAILAELDRVYGYMLSRGATAAWETIKGEADFGGAGSLCHGWSALPIYYYSILENNQ